MSSDQLTLFAVDSPVKTYQWPAAARAWLESGRDCGMSSIALLTALSRELSSSKTSPAYYPPTAGKTLPPSFAGWSSAGMASAGGYLTLSLMEWHSGATVCSLSQVLEPQVAPKYFLSAKAARGILRRAEKRGKTLPELLARALQQVADSELTLNAPVD